MGAGGLNFRVRDGTGWTPAALITNRTLVLAVLGVACATWQLPGLCLRHLPVSPDRFSLSDRLSLSQTCTVGQLAHGCCDLCALCLVLVRACARTLKTG